MEEIKKLVGNLTKKPMIISVDDLEEHPYHREMYDPIQEGYFKESIKRTNGEPIHAPVVVSAENQGGCYRLVGGAGRLDEMIRNGAKEIEVIYIEMEDENQIRNLIVDLNKQRVKTGRELRNEFIHHCLNYPPKKGIKNYNRLELISGETAHPEERVKKLIRLESELGGTQYDWVITKVFGDELSLHQGLKFCSVLKNETTQSIVPEVVNKLIDNGCDFDRVIDIGNQMDLTNNSEFEIALPFLKNESSVEEISNTIKQLDKTKGVIRLYEDGKSPVKLLNREYISENSIIINGDSATVDLRLLVQKMFRMMVGSCEYGYGTKRKPRPDQDNHDELSKMSAQEFAQYTAKIYHRYLPYLTKDGSIYLIVYDYKSDEYSGYSCFTEHLVLEMKKLGMYLVGRKLWVKTNPLRRQYSYKDAVEGYEFIYRFSANPEDLYTNPYMLMREEAETVFKLTQGCTNHSNNPESNRGGKYFQSNIKKVLNTLDENYCEEIIRGNVGNPGDYFRVAEKVKHSSTSPIYLTSTLILEGSAPGDSVLDIWNGVGNSMISSLLLGRQYAGIEIEENYYNQTIKKVIETEKVVKEYSIMEQLYQLQESREVA
ncbi:MULTISPECIES: DNA modification methylase [Flavobacterium]|uniref:DNA modification methylase n=1 Tax=Flavobacterium keumense TaxID=1306518 RepID=A0ABY8N5K5_9FLAO|nr:MULTISPECIES: DNA modification methylase [Flavobacterium]WGK94544.1 DNA modification methylase [Flavobacterium keumense]